MLLFIKLFAWKANVLFILKQHNTIIIIKGVNERVAHAGITILKEERGVAVVFVFVVSNKEERFIEKQTFR